mgnify:CR=1 FL=1|jgi:TP901 family phage tail tape measure protein
MAGGIKGITVKIGGDTTELGRSLSEATTKSTALQRELKGVNSLLKFDSGNVTLLKQKADLLKKSIEETKNKQEALNEVLKKVESGEIEMTEEEYRNLQREIALTDQKLEALEQESKNFGSVGAQQVANFGSKMQEVGGKVENVGKKLSALSAVSGAVLGGSIVSASNFQDAMAKVNTIADTSKVSLGDLSSQVLDLSNQTGISAEDIADATYNAISAGQDTADAVNFVSNATSLAKAGFTDTGSAIDVLTTIMNAYGLEADKVGSVSDMLIQTQNKGKTTVAELSSSMGKIIPTANSMGVGLDQLCAGYSIMTAKGIATAESTTYMNSMLNELGKGGTKVSEALKNKTGKSFQELMADGNSLGDVLQIVKDYADETGVGFNDLWGSAEAGKAGLTLLSDGADAFNEAVSGMNDSTDATSDALGKLETPSQKAKVAINQLKNAGITLGTTALSALSPLIDKVASAVQKLTTWFNNLSPGVQQIILIVLGLVTALGPVLIVIGKVISSVGTILTFAPKIVTAIKGIGTAFKALGAFMSANPLGVIIIALTALVAGLIYAYNHSEKFREIVNNAFSKVKEVVGTIVDALVTFFTETVPTALGSMIEWFKSIPEKISSAISTVVSVVSEVFNSVKTTVTTILNAILSVVNTVWNGIKTAIQIVVNAIHTVISTVFNVIKTVITTYVNAWKTVITTVWNAIKTVITTVVNGIKTVITTVFNAIKTVITTIVNGIKTTVTTVWNGIKSVITTVINGIKSTVTSVWNGIKSNTTSVWNGIKSGISSIINGIKSTVSSVVNGIKSTVSSAWNGIKSTTSSVWNSIKSAITTPINSAKSAFSSAIRAMRNALHFSWSLPKLKLPHISVSGGVAPFGIGGKGSLPHFSISWYKDGAIFKKPTIFNTPLGLKGVGEAGAEAVAPISELMDYVTMAVNNGDISDRIDRLEGVIANGFANMSRGSQIVLDTGVLVGETIDRIDDGLSDKYNKTVRGW